MDLLSLILFKGSWRFLITALNFVKPFILLIQIGVYGLHLLFISHCNPIINYGFKKNLRPKSI